MENRPRHRVCPGTQPNPGETWRHAEGAFSLPAATSADGCDMYLFFDTETSGLPRDWNAPVTDVNNWPRLVQIGWIACGKSGSVTESVESLIRPEGFRIEPDAIARHGISNQRALADGLDVIPVLEELHTAISNAGVLVGHNLRFDTNVVGAEFIRAGMTNPVQDCRTRCTMHEATQWCAIPGAKHQFKWPSLADLHRRLFGAEFSNAHSALADAEACKRCFFELCRLGVINA